jgi:hypothetical protein
MGADTTDNKGLRPDDGNFVVVPDDIYHSIHRALGNAASNQTLSEARSAAIVAKLVELGIAAHRLTASGKGQNNPIADFDILVYTFNYISLHQ